MADLLAGWLVAQLSARGKQADQAGGSGNPGTAADPSPIDLFDAAPAPSTTAYLTRRQTPCFNGGMTNETATKCPGCFEPGCPDCEDTPEQKDEIDAWDSRPSKIHGRRISAPSEKQVSFIRRLWAEKGMPGDVELVINSTEKPLTKGTASELIDALIKMQPMVKDEAGQVTGTRFGGTEKQENFIRSLCAQLSMADEQIEAKLSRIRDRAHASQVIDDLKLDIGNERMLAQAGRPSRLVVSSHQTVELEDAIYLIDGEVRKVYHTVHGNNTQVAKIWNTETMSFEYAGKRGLKGLTPAHKMTLEQAQEFGRVYGVCCSCGATLTDEVSIANGIGPICAQKF